jgi:vacuolar-type H+-ATPase subunit E/Vma4
MENDEKGKETLISGILRDAGKEAETITREAEKAAEARREAVRRQAERIIEEAEEKAREQVESIRRNSARAIETEMHRIRLKTQKELLNRIVREAEVKIEKMMDGKNYRDVLKNWITEAALGLSVDKAEVNASRREMEMIDNSLLEEAAGAVKEKSGRQMVLTKSGGNPLPAQGVVLTSSDGKTAFNNQVHVRILRYQSQIRSLVNSRLFAGDRK